MNLLVSHFSVCCIASSSLCRMHRLQTIHIFPYSPQPSIFLSCHHSCILRALWCSINFFFFSCVHLGTTLGNIHPRCYNVISNNSRKSVLYYLYVAMHANANVFQCKKLKFTCHQESKSLPCGRDKLTPPRNSAGRIFPSQIVTFTKAGTSCGVTRPYQTPEPRGV